MADTTGELEAMHQCFRELKPLPYDQKMRVIRWLNEVFSAAASPEEKAHSVGLVEPCTERKA